MDKTKCQEEAIRSHKDKKEDEGKEDKEGKEKKHKCSVCGEMHSSNTTDKV